MPLVKNKISPTLFFVDELFNEKKTDKYHLSMEVGLQNFTLAILDKDSNKFIALEYYTFQNVYNYSDLVENLDFIKSESKLLKNKFNSASTAIVSNKSTLVPVALYDNNAREKIFTINHELENEELLVDDLYYLDAKNLFSIPHILLHWLQKAFSNIKIHHFSSSLIESVLPEFKNKTGNTIIVHVQLSHFEVIIPDGKKLLFYNTFRHQTSEDFIYYLLFVCEQLKLNPENIQVVFLGEIERNSAIFSLTEKYIRNVKFGSRSDNFEYSYKLDNLPMHFYYNLFSQYLANSKRHS